MRITPSRQALTAMLLLVLAPPAGFARQGSDSWGVVAAVPEGEKLEIELRSGGRVKGKFATASAAGVEITAGKKTTSLSRGDVLRVYRVVGRTRGKSTLRGAGIGGAIGAGIGLIFYLPYRDDFIGWVVPGFGAIGAGIGAGVGAAFSSGQKRVLIYQS